MATSSNPSPRAATGSRASDELFSTPFVASWIGQARPGDRFTPDPARRAAAWSHWAASQLTEISTGERTYPAFWLDGLFYDPHGTGPKLRPHLEIARGRLRKPDPSFPDRLAHAGNGLAFDWWVYPEVTALRRNVLTTSAGDPSPLFELLATIRGELEAALVQLNTMVAPRFREIAMLLQTAPDGLSTEAAGDFTGDDVARYLPAAATLQLEVRYDEKLRDRSGPRASRRVGIWQLRGRDTAGQRFQAGVVTPRLTQRSTLTDELFLAEREAPGALLVRGLVLRRLLATRFHDRAAADLQVGDPPVAASQTPTPKGPRPYLRAVPAQPNKRLPEAGVDAAIRFLTTYPDEADAWRQLREWAGTTYRLTTAEAGFKAAHRSARRAVERAEDPHRDDIDVILPLGWADGKLVRVTFARPPTSD